MLSLSLGRLDPLLARAQKTADRGRAREPSKASIDLLQAALGVSAALLTAAAARAVAAGQAARQRHAEGSGDLSIRVPEKGAEDELKFLVPSSTG